MNGSGRASPPFGGPSIRRWRCRLSSLSSQERLGEVMRYSSAACSDSAFSRPRDRTEVEATIPSPHLHPLLGGEERESALSERGGAPSPLFVDIGPIESIPLGQGRSFIIAGCTIAVFRQRDGRVFAIDNQCPHRGGPLAEGILGDGKVICPMHSWKIDLASGRCLGEAASLRTYGVRVLNGRVFVQCGTEE
jgi:nitrite reductase (NADH) small subunit